MNPVRRPRLSDALLIVGGVALVAATVASPTRARAAASQSWPPFVLVAGLLVLGVVAHRDGLFETLGGVAGRVRAHPAVLLVVLLALVAAVSAVLNLDTSVAFLTPVLVLAARRRRLSEEPFLYGALLMSNAASLLLPGSNLTNLLVLSHEHVAGTVFAARMLPGWIAAVAVTAAFMVAYQRRQLRQQAPDPDSDHPVAYRPAWSSLAVGVAVVLMLVLRSPALPVLAVAGLVRGEALKRRSLTMGQIAAAVDPGSLAGIFGIAVALGTLARVWDGPAHLMTHANAAQTAGVGALASVVVNNLPAAVLLASQRPAHPRALLLGLNLGPNLAVTGSLSALIWIRAAHTVKARPSPARLSRMGIVLVPISLAVSALALRLLAPTHL